MHDGSDAFRFQLAGNLSKDAAQDLEQAWRSASSVIGEKRVIFDLSGLTSIDASGQDLLSAWTCQGALLGAISHHARARLQIMTQQPVTDLANATAVAAWRPLRTASPWVVAFFMLLFPANAATLKTETLEVWENYIQAVNIRIRNPLNAGKAFLWMDESPDRIAKVRRGDIVVSAAGTKTPKEVPSGLIHDWIGAVFIANSTLDQVLAIVRDYGRYKDFYPPAVIDSKPLALNDIEDRFSIVLVNKALFRRSALDSDYKSSQFRVDDRRRYTIAQTTRIQDNRIWRSGPAHIAGGRRRRSHLASIRRYALRGTGRRSLR
jgi:ABC-type transporter Mla MlaB component